VTGPDLADLREIAALVHRRELARLDPVLREEARLRAALARLDTMVDEARAAGVTLMTLSGGDTVWTTWVERQRSGLHSDLARVLARKAQETEALLAAFGRVNALEDLARTAARAARRDRERRTVEAVGNLTALRGRGT
jgi:membrane protein required for beta-lactamase induction